MTLPKTQSEHKSDIQFIFIGDDNLVQNRYRKQNVRANY